MVAAVVLALLAGVVRGFTGFGYAVIVSFAFFPAAISE